MTDARKTGDVLHLASAENLPDMSVKAWDSLPSLRTGPAAQTALMIGDSPAMRRVAQRIQRFAAIDAPVLIIGKTGTGKKLAAQILHERSSHNAGPFMAIDCATLPESLIGSELFGYEKGAFAGAHARKFGLIELANGGTLFLDEIGDLSLELQGRLLRFLQEGEIFRLGSRQAVKVRTRVIAATHVDLCRATRAGRFREDLFYRLNVLVLTMPSLRARRGDIELLATAFLHTVAHELGHDIEGFTPQALATLRAHDWPGNVRELITTIRRAVIMANDRLIDQDDLGLPAADMSLKPRAPSRRSRTDLSRVLEALRQHGGNRSRAALELGISRVTLYRVLRRNHHSDGHESIC